MEVVETEKEFNLVQKAAKLNLGKLFDILMECYQLGDDRKSKYLTLAYEVMNRSGYVNDPDDKRRTLEKAEEALAHYVSKYVAVDKHVDVPYLNIETGLVGVEVPFCIQLDFDYDDDATYTCQIVGRVDGIINGRKGVTVHENKTASRLDHSWHEAKILDHQATTYAIAGEVITGEVIEDVVYLGLAIPQPKNYDLGGYTRHPVSRPSERKEAWFDWVWSTLRVYEDWRYTPLEAPEYTHSCNRYFRPCSLLPLCASYGDERRLVFEEMHHHRWNPLDHEGGSDD